MAGAPEGNKNAVRGRQATRALELALAIWDGDNKLENIVESNGTKALVKLWLKQIEEAAAEGDTNKMKLITERLDGRPSQSVEMSGSLGLHELADEQIDDELDKLLNASE